MKTTIKHITADVDHYGHLVSVIGELLLQSKIKAYQQVNTLLIQTYREIWKYIVEYEQKWNEKAEYGSKLFDKLSKDLRNLYGKGFSRSNLIYIRLLYIRYPISQSLPDQLTRTHLVEIIGIDDKLERSFYEKQCIKEKWSTRELKRQKNSWLFMRLALSKNKWEILELAHQGQTIIQASDIIKEPYILEFLDLSESYQEKDLEKSIIDSLQQFLLELGRWFTFVWRQYRITLWNEHYYVDLVFYHRILKCFVLIDLKVNKATHLDIGQMNMYLNYFNKEERVEWDNESIGIILSADKDEAQVEYALWWITNQLFVSKYQLYLPDKETLQAQLQHLLNS